MTQCLPKMSRYLFVTFAVGIALLESGFDFLLDLLEMTNNSP